MGPMWRSPHKKRRPSKPPVVVNKDTGSLESWPFKSAVTRSYDGNDGHFKTIRGRRVKVQYKRKAHLRAAEPPGRPRGTCLGPKDKDKLCRCGKHNGRRS